MTPRELDNLAPGSTVTVLLGSTAIRFKKVTAPPGGRTWKSLTSGKQITTRALLGMRIVDLDPVHSNREKAQQRINHKAAGRKENNNGNEIN